LHATPPTAFCTHSLHDALPIYLFQEFSTRVSMLIHTVSHTHDFFLVFQFLINVRDRVIFLANLSQHRHHLFICPAVQWTFYRAEDRKSTRLNSSHVSISYAVFS